MCTLLPEMVSISADLFSVDLLTSSPNILVGDEKNLHCACALEL